VLIFVIFSWAEILSNDKSVIYEMIGLHENALKLVQKVHTGTVNGLLRVYCAAPSFAYYYRAVSSK
jgi:uncharacterized membrane protein